MRPWGGVADQPPRLLEVLSHAGTQNPFPTNASIRSGLQSLRARRTDPSSRWNLSAPAPPRENDPVPFSPRRKRVLAQRGRGAERPQGIAPKGNGFGAAMSSSPLGGPLGMGDEDVASPFHAGAGRGCAQLDVSPESDQVSPSARCRADTRRNIEQPGRLPSSHASVSASVSASESKTKPSMRFDPERELVLDPDPDGAAPLGRRGVMGMEGILSALRACGAAAGTTIARRTAHEYSFQTERWKTMSPECSTSTNHSHAFGRSGAQLWQA
jgi:hypothetical protein